MAGALRGEVPEEGETPFAGYLLLRRIAVGGTSEVYLARPREGSSPAPRVAIKRLLPDLTDDPETRRTFALEAKLHAAVKHHNVVEIYESGEFDGEPYIAMEYVSGVDLFRLMRFAEPPEGSLDDSPASARRAIGVPLAVHVARELCAALACVHRLTDAAGQALGVVHRDVTPSNIYLSQRGDVKLGDFGIARAGSVRRPQPSVALKGKYAYLAPEQVSAEPFDHRADLFSLTVVLAEMLLAAPLFPGAGQLAVLLAIRDVRIDPLRAIRATLPDGLFEVFERALARFPDDRYPNAHELSEALEPFDGDREGMQRELAMWVKSASAATGFSEKIGRALEGVAAHEARERPVDSSRSSFPDPDSQRPTMQPGEIIRCRIRRKGGEAKRVGFAKLVELLATGQVGPEDEVDLGDGFCRARDVLQLARYLPPSTGTTQQLQGPGVPDYATRIPESTMPEVLTWVVQNIESGLLIAESASARCELYFDKGQLILAASTEASTLLGEYLVAKGAIDRSELEMAILVMHKYDGHLGDTLVALGLVDPVAVFQGIRAQGRRRVAALFAWRTGTLSFYRDVKPTKLDFRLDLDVPIILLSGLAEVRSDEELLRSWFRRRSEVYAGVSPPPSWAKSFTWPAIFLTLLRTLGSGKRIDEMLDQASAPKTGPGIGRAAPSRSDLLRALEAGIHLGIIIARPDVERSPHR